MSDTTDLESYLLVVAHLSDPLITAVHDEDPAAVAQVIQRVRAIRAPDGVDPMTALASVLAAQVRPAVSFHSRLAWVRELGMRAAS